MPIKPANAKAFIGWCLFTMVPGLFLFGMGFWDIATHQATAGSWVFAIIGIVIVAGMFLAVQSTMKMFHPCAYGLIELLIGIVICVINLQGVTEFKAVTFYSVLSAGVFACVKGLKDTWEGAQ
jgi:hypothetical protein